MSNFWGPLHLPHTDFWGGEATDWLDRTVRVATLHSLTVEQWIEQYRMLREKNRTLLRGGIAAGKPEAEHSDGRGGGQSSDRERKRRRMMAKKAEPRPGKKRSPR